MTLNDDNCQTQTLILVPTEMEREWITKQRSNDQEILQVQVCGFGVISAGINTTRLLASGDYCRVILLGIAGTYDLGALPVGAACIFQRVGCFGIGAGEGAIEGYGDGTGFQTASELGFTQSSELPLAKVNDGSATRDLLLTVTSAAASESQVASRLAKFPNAVAEDMEAFSVAMASANFDCPVTVIRGISNIAGDRNHAAWQIESAMESAVDLLNSVFPG